MTGPAWDAIVLTGGRARRMGGADKAAVVVGGRTLASCVAEAVAEARRVIVVGPLPPEFPAGTIATQEIPPGGGPVAAVAAGVAHVTAEQVAVMAVDLPFVTAHAVGLVRRARHRDVAVAVPVDGDGRDQYLCSVWSTPALRAALAAVGDPAGVSMHRLVAAAGPVTRVGDLGEVWFDCDTPADVVAADTQGGAMTDAMADLDRWMAEAAEALGLAGLLDLEATRDLLLDVAREVAHAVDRPAAPVTAFLLGLAAGRAGPRKDGPGEDGPGEDGPGEDGPGEDPQAATNRLAETVRALAARWPG